MDREQAKDIVKGYLYEYLQQQGINTRKPFKCLNPTHNDNNPSMSYDRKRNKCHCFSCGVDWDIIDLIKVDYGLSDDKAAFDKAYSLYNITIENGSRDKQIKPKQQLPESDNVEDYTQYFLKAHSKVNDTDYLHKRGLSDYIIDKFMLGYEDNFNRGTKGLKWQAVIIPTTKYTYTVRNTAANVDKKDRIRKVGNNVLFNKQALFTSEPVFIVEGEFDALSFMEVGGSAVALGSTANYHKLVALVKENNIKASMIILALDNDADGKATADKILKELANCKKSSIACLQDVYGAYKDANEVLQKDRAMLEDIVRMANNMVNEEKERVIQEYQANNAAAQLDSFVESIKNTKKDFTPTGFAIMDKCLEGGLYEGLYVVGAISSLGKTTYVMQMADQIAQSGSDVLVFSLEMARTQLMSKSISRLTLLDCMQKGKKATLAKTSRGVATGSRYINYSTEEKQLIADCIEQYREYGKNVYITEGIGNIGVEEVKAAVQKHISITGKRPVVIIDYLQILAPYDVRASDKQNTDKAVLELKRLSRDLNIAVVGISSLNRQSYNSPIGMEAFKESGAIEYSSDVLIGMQLKGVGQNDFDVNVAKQKTPREVEVVILKNRDGVTGSKVEYEYYAMFNYFKEIGTIKEDVEVLAPADKDGFRQIIKGKTPFDK